MDFLNDLWKQQIFWYIFNTDIFHGIIGNREIAGIVTIYILKTNVIKISKDLKPMKNA